MGCFGRLQSRLRLDDESVIDDHINTLNRQYVSLVRHVDAHFSRHAMIAHQQFALESHNVHVLEKSEAKRVVNLVKRTNDGSREALLE